MPQTGGGQTLKRGLHSGWQCPCSGVMHQLLWSVCKLKVHNSVTKTCLNKRSVTFKLDMLENIGSYTFLGDIFQHSGH